MDFEDNKIAPVVISCLITIPKINDGIPKSFTLQIAASSYFALHAPLDIVDILKILLLNVFIIVCSPLILLA